jgi:phosphoglycolate phosphatase
MNFIFDLDGTLIDSYAGIEKAFISTIKQLNCRTTENFNLKNQIGKPLFDIFFEATNSKSLGEQAIPIFRSTYQLNYISGFSVYENVHQSLELLVNAGHKLFIVTNKAAVLATEIILLAGLKDFFIGIYGPELNQSVKKFSLIQNLLDEHENVKPNNCIMIGDTRNDFEAANLFKIPIIILLHGYGKKIDFEEKEIDFFCESFNDLTATLFAKYANL